MSYINLSVFNSSGLKPADIFFLAQIKQTETEYLIENLTNSDYNRFKELNLIEHVKQLKKDEHLYKSLRLSKKCKDFLNDLEVPLCTQGDIEMRDFLIKMYLNHEDTERVVGNVKLIAMYISTLRFKLDLSLHQFYYLCDYFLAEQKFTKKLENVFFDKNKHRYGEFKNHIEDSSLYQFFEQRKFDVEQYWKLKIKE